MTEHTEAISKLLHEAAETHHRVYRIVDGDDADWASGCGAGEAGQFQVEGSLQAQAALTADRTVVCQPG
jgi:hypothetical protein